MGQTAQVELAKSAEAYRGVLGLDELQGQTIRLATLCIPALALGALFLSVFEVQSVPPRILLLTVGLLGISLLAHVVARRRPVVGAVVFVACLALLLAIAEHYLPGAILAPWYSLIVLLAAALLGAAPGVLVAILTSLVLLASTDLSAGIVSEGSAFSAILLSWASLFAYWLVSRPTRTALDWAWSSYLRALDQTVKARERQAELARLSKGLSESNYQLEQLNLELEQARREAREARRLKAEFAAFVSHELRTPLNLISGFCEMMVLSPSSAYGQKLPSSYQQDLQAIYRNAVHISSLVDDILDLSQIDADRMALHKDWSSLSRVVAEAVAAVETLFEDRDLEIRVFAEENLPPIFIDHTRIRQILINLLGNAVRFLDEGGVAIRLTSQGDTVTVSVADTGPGIPADELPYVFEEYFQVASARSSRQGTGLGLTISKRFAELHGGTMWAESAGLGHGTTFFLKLPVADEGASTSGDASYWDDRRSMRVRGQADRRVLLIDELGDVGKVFQRYLEGYQVVHAKNLAAVKRQVKAGPIRALILGSQSAQAEWRSCAPASLRALPVISCRLQTTRRLADELGVAEYLVKPITREQLRSAVRRLDRPIRSVVIVDDDPEMTSLLTRLMKSLTRGCHARIAHTGREAINLLREQQPDLVLLDLMMPDVNGYSVIEEIRKDPALDGTPILVISAHGQEDESIVADELSITRADGLTVGEIMRWVKGGLEAGHESNTIAPTPPGVPVE